MMALKNPSAKTKLIANAIHIAYYSLAIANQKSDHQLYKFVGLGYEVIDCIKNIRTALPVTKPNDDDMSLDDLDDNKTIISTPDLTNKNKIQVEQTNKLLQITQTYILPSIEGIAAVTSTWATQNGNIKVMHVCDNLTLLSRILQEYISCPPKTWRSTIHLCCSVALTISLIYEIKQYLNIRADQFDENGCPLCGGTENVGFTPCCATKICVECSNKWRNQNPEHSGGIYNANLHAFGGSHLANTDKCPFCKMDQAEAAKEAAALLHGEPRV
jgi:hypothetical protein